MAWLFQRNSVAVLVALACLTAPLETAGQTPAAPAAQPEQFRTPSGEADTNDPIDAATTHILENTYQKELRPKLIALLAHRNPKVREKAAHGFAYTDAADEAVEPLGKLLVDPNVPVRQAAVQAIGRQKTYAERLVPALIARLRDPDAQVVQFAMFGLGQAGPKAAAAVEPLVGILNANVRSREMVVVEARPTGGVFGALRDAFGGGSALPEARVENPMPKPRPTDPAIVSQESHQFHGGAATALGEIGPAAKPAIPSLVKHLDGPPEGKDREWWSSATEESAVALGKLGATEELLKVAGHRDVHRRSAALQGLASVNPTTDAVVEVLAKAAQSNEERERQQAIRALGQARPSNDAIVKALAGPLQSKNVQTRQAAGYAIQQIDPKLESAVPVLLIALKDTDPDVRGAAARALAEYKSNPQARLAALLLAATDDSSSARDPAVRAIDNDAKANYPLLLAVLKDEKADPAMLCGALAGVNEMYYNHRDDLKPLATAFVQSDKATLETKVYAARLLRNIDSETQGLAPVFGAGLKSKKVDARRLSASMLGQLKNVEAAPDLIAALGDRNNEVLSQVIYALGALKAEAAVAPLCKIAQMTKSEVRGAAISALGEIGVGGATSAPVLLKIVLAGEGWSGSGSGEALGKVVVASKLEVAPMVDQLLPLLNAEGERRSTAVHAISQLPSQGCEAAIPALTKMIDGQDQWMRRQAIETLAVHGTIAASAAPRLVAALAVPDNKDIRASIVRALGNSAGEPKTAVPAIAKLLADEDNDLRKGALEALGKYGAGAETAVAAIAKLLNHGEPQTRKAAAEALGKIGPTAKDAIEPLVKIADSDPNSEPRIAAAGALLAIGPEDPAALAGAAAILKSDDYYVRSWFDGLKEKQGVVLAAGLKHTDAAVRSAALEKLGRLEDQKAAEPAYLAAIKDSDPKVRAMAAAALTEIGGHTSAIAPVLIEALGSGDEKARDSAQRALRSLGRGAAPALTAVLEDSQAAPATKAAACRMLTERNLVSGSMLATVLKLREADDENLKNWATVAAAAGDPKERTEARLTPLLSSKQPELRSAALMQFSQLKEDEPITNEKTVSLLITFLSDSADNVRSSAASAVGKCQFTAAHGEALAAALRQEESRYAVLNALQYGNPPAALAPRLVELLKDEKNDYSYSVGQVLSRIGQPAVAPLLKAAGDAQLKPERRLVALTTLGEIENLPPDTRQTLAGIVDGQDQRLRIVAASVLARQKVNEAKVLTALAEAIPLAGQEGNDALGESAQQGFSSLREKGAAAIPQVAPLLKSDNAKVRQLAATILSTIGSESDEALAALTEAMAADKEIASSLTYRLTNAGAKAIPHLTKILASNDVRVVRDAAQALGRLGSDAASAVPQLKPLLARKDEAALAAATALVRIDPATEGVLPVLMAALDSKENEQVDEACGALAQLQEKAAPAVDRLVKLLDGDHRESAANTLAAIGPAAAPAVPALMKQLKSGKSFYCWAGALGAIGPQAAEAAPLLIAELKSERNFDSAVDALGKMGPAGDAAIPVLAEVVKDEARAADVVERLYAFGPRATPVYLVAVKSRDEKIRALAAAKLTELGGHGAAAAPVLLESLTSSERRVRQDAERTLRSMGRRALPAIHAALADPKAPAATKVGACKLLLESYIATSKTKQAVAALRTSSDPNVRTWGTIAAAAMGDQEEMMGDLLPLLAATDVDVRSAAVTALARHDRSDAITDDKAIRQILKLLGDEDGEIRNMAGAAIRRCRLTDAHVQEIAKAISNKQSRDAAIGALGYGKTLRPELIPTLIAALNDDYDEPWRRTQVAATLARIGQPAVAPLLAVAQDPQAKSQTREAAIVALGRIEKLPTESQRALARIVKGQDDRLRFSAAAALAQQGVAHPKVLEALAAAIVAPVQGEDDYFAIQCAQLGFEALGESAAAAIPLVVPHLKSREERQRQAAANVLFVISGTNQAIFPPLIAALEANEKDGDWLDYQFSECGAAAVPHLIKALDSDKTYVVRAAARALQLIGPDAAAAAPKLKSLLAHKDGVAFQAAAAMTRIAPKAEGPLPVLLAALDGADKRQRQEALEALSILKEKAAPATERLIKLLEGDDAASAAYTLGHIGPGAAAAVPALRKQLNSGQDYDAFAMALGGIGPDAKAAVPQLMADLKDEQRVEQASEALAKMGPAGEEAIPVLIEMLKDDTMSLDAARQLRAFGPRAAAAVKPLAALIVADDDQISMAAAWSLGHIGKPAHVVVPQLMKVLAEGSAEQADRAARAVAQLEPPSIVPQLVTLLASDDDQRSNAAAFVLQVYGPEASPAMKTLITNLAKPERSGASITVLSAIGPAAAPAVGALTKLAMAEDTSESGQPMQAVAALGAIGPAAKAAVPQLEAKLKTARKHEKYTLEPAIWKIDPARAAALGLDKPRVEKDE